MNEKRHSVTVTAFALVLILLVGWQSYHVVIDRYFLQDKGRLRIERTQEIPVMRGVIHDRHGEPLAISTPVSSVVVNPSQVSWTNQEYRDVAKTLGLTVDSLKSKIAEHRTKSFLYLARRQDQKVENALQALDLPHLLLQRDYRRYYPLGEVAAHVTGITDIDEVGIEGLERAFDRHLKGVKGVRRVARDNEGRQIKDIRYVRLPEFGEDLHITLDSRLQFLAHEELQHVVEEYQAESASLILLDVESGGILAMANTPTYNPNNPSRRPWSHMRNRAVTDLVEPGSTFKPFLVMEALETEHYTRDTVIDTSPGWLNVKYKTIKDPRDYGALTLTNVLVKSSQVGATKLALQMPEDTLLHAHNKAGYQDYVLAGLPGESAGKLSGDEITDPITRATMSYGYGFSVTALQLARSYLTIATGGLRRQISILMDDQREVEDQRVYTQAHAYDMLNMLTGVLGPTGTAFSSRIEGFNVAGKTGTVRNLAVEGGYSEEDHTTLFVGMVPAEHPEYLGVVIVISPKPKGPGQKVSGGSVSAPVFKRLASRAIQLRRPPSKSNSLLATNSDRVP